MTRTGIKVLATRSILWAWLLFALTTWLGPEARRLFAAAYDTVGAQLLVSSSMSMLCDHSAGTAMGATMQVKQQLRLLG